MFLRSRLCHTPSGRCKACVSTGAVKKSPYREFSLQRECIGSFSKQSSMPQNSFSQKICAEGEYVYRLLRSERHAACLPEPMEKFLSRL